MHLALLCVVSAIAFSRHELTLFRHLDGSHIQGLANDQLAWWDFGLSLKRDLIRGPGNLSLFPNARLLGHFSVHAIWDGRIDPRLVYACIAFELFVATYVAGRLIGMSAGASLVGSWIITLGALPVFGSPLLYPILAIVPSNAEGIAIFAVACAFLASLPHGQPLRWGVAVALVVLLAYHEISSPLSIVIGGLPVAGYGAIAVWMISRQHGVLSLAHDPGSRRMALLATILLAGAVSQSFGLVYYSAPRFFSSEMVFSQGGLEYASMIFHPQPWGRLLIVLGAVGALQCRTSSPCGTTARAAATTHLVVTGALLLLGLVVTQLPSWPAPSVLYMETILWPFHALYAAYAVSSATTRILRGRQIPTPVRAACPICFASAAIVGIVDSPLERNPWRLQTPNAISRVLAANLAISPGTPFRGRVANFVGMTRPEGTIWYDFHRLDSELVESVQYDARFIGPWRDSVPTLEEYSPTLSPLSYLVFTRMLARAGDRQIRNIILFTKPNIPFLAAHGVRYVITETPVAGATVAATLSTGVLGAERLYLGEISDPNLGHYSPVEVRLARDATEALARLRAGIDLAQEVILFAPPPPGLDLVRAQGVSLTVQRNGDLRVRASSRSSSLLLLPFEYSACQRAIAHSGDPRLVQANLMQTGLLFRGELDTTLTYRYGPLDGTTCRLRDAWSLEALGGRAAAQAFPLTGSTAPISYP